MSLLISPGPNVCMSSVSTGDFCVHKCILKKPLFNLSPNSLLLHGLHFLCTGNHIVYNLFLFICQVWTRTRAWLHGPAAPVSQTYSPGEFTLPLSFWQITSRLTDLHGRLMLDVWMNEADMLNEWTHICSLESYWAVMCDVNLLTVLYRCQITRQHKAGVTKESTAYGW